MKSKLRSTAGFSLAETLLAVLILLLVSLIVANGVPAAKEAYEKVVIGANAKVLLSTTVSALRDELATARDVVVDSTTKSITYYSADTGTMSKISLKLDSTPPAIMLQEYITLKPDKTGYLPTVPERNLVSGKTATKDLYVVYNEANLTPDVSNHVYESITFTNLEVYWKSKPDTAMASIPSLTIRFIKPVLIPGI